MWYFNASQIRNIHFEISNYCNAACPECPREDVNEIDPATGKNRFSHWIDTHFLSLEIIQKNFNQQTTPRLKAVSFCGCFGDALTHPHLIKILEYLIAEFPELYIEISTNGGLKTVEYWIKLANVLKKAKDYAVYWGIDGLEDTNHVYRVNVRWKKLQENFRAFNSAGGNSVWQFIVFPHNYHQVDQAKEMSKAEGFSAFKTIISRRYSDKKLSLLPEEFQHKKHNPEKYVDKPINYINYDYQSMHFNNIDKNTGKLIVCDSQERHNIFVFSEGTVWPCNKLGAWIPNDCVSLEWEQKHNARYNNSLHNFNINEILSNKWFENLYNSHKDSTFCFSCTQQCGKISGKRLFETRDEVVLEKF